MDNQNQNAPGNKSYQEWLMKVIAYGPNELAKVKFQKIELLRPDVKLTPEEAKMVNDGHNKLGDENCKLFLLPGENELFFMDELSY